MIPKTLTRGVLADKTVYLWDRLKPNRTQFSEIFSDMTHVTALINSEAATVWTDCNFSGLWANPLIHRLLTIQIPLAMLNGETDPDGVMQEVGRLGCVLYFGEMRRKFGVYPVITRIQVQKIKIILSEHTIEWRPFEPLLLWTLTLAGIEASFYPDNTDRSWFIAELSRLAKNMGMQTAEDAKGCLRKMPWIEEVYDDHAELLWRDVVVRIEMGQGQEPEQRSDGGPQGEARSGFFYWDHAAAIMGEDSNITVTRMSPIRRNDYEP